MVRLACISLPSLPLQMALGRRPVQSVSPLAVVRNDRPASPLLQLDRRARDEGLRPGMRYSSALALVPELTAVTVGAEDRAAARQQIRRILDRWSPRVEVCPLDPDSFWADPRGLEGLFGTEAQWGAAVRQDLGRLGFRAVVIIGSTRLGTYILTRTRRRSTVVRTPEAERAAIDGAPLTAFPLGLRQRRLLDTLGVTTWGELTALPADDWERRLGPLLSPVRQLQSWDTVPLQPLAEAPDQTVSKTLEAPVSDRPSLLIILETLLEEVLAPLVRFGRRVSELRTVFVLESGAQEAEVLRPAEPTARVKPLAKLLDLRLQKLVLTEGVVQIRLHWEQVGIGPQAGDWFETPGRDAGAGDQALALVQARWGNEAAVHPVLADSAWPNRAFVWAPWEGLRPPRLRTRVLEAATAVRRIWVQGPRPGGPAGRRRAGPFRFREATDTKPLERDDWLLEGTRGEVAWVSWDPGAGVASWEGVVD